MTAAQVAAFAAASQLLLRQAAPAPVPHEAEPVPVKGFWGRWLYLDVLLPMVAVIIVLVVLLAWVG